MNPIYFLNDKVIGEIVFLNSISLLKLFLVSYVLFYFIPKKLFPQPKTSSQIEVIIINIIYMVAYIEIFVTFFIFFRIFSIPIFLVLLVATKLLFIKFYDKKNPFEFLNKLKIDIMINILDILDNPKQFYKSYIQKQKEKIIQIQTKITFFRVLKFLLYMGVIIYIFINSMSSGLQTLSYRIADTAQFVDWVNHLERNILYSDTQIGADFYGISILIFFISTFTNIDTIILFSIYPALLFLVLYLSIYFVLKDFTKSDFVALFGIMVYGFFFMSPLSLYLLGDIIKTANPIVEHFFNFSFYIPTKEQLLQDLTYFSFEAYQRYSTGMAYEHASIFVLLNAYFLIKFVEFKQNKYLILYTLTLFLVFTFHGGGAIPLLVISILIAINSILFFKLDKNILKKGILAVVVATIFGNLWVFSILKYGIPRDFGAAAPFLDKWLHTKSYVENIIESGIFDVSFIAINKVHCFLFFLLVINFIIAFFKKNRFLNTSFLLIIVGVFILYFGPTFGFPNLVNFLRLSEYYFFAITLLFSITFYHIYKFLPKIVILAILYIIFIFSILAIPKWFNSKEVDMLINKTEWSEIPKFILKINKTNLRYTWTFVSYVQDYSKVKNKAYHINSAEFLLKYSPLDKYLKIPTQKVFIAVEDFVNPYMGMNEWYYRWRSKIQNNLKAWIATYSANHNNIKIIYRSKLVTIYEIDNQKYINYLKNKERK